MKKLILSALVLTTMAIADGKEYYLGVGAVANETHAKGGSTDYLGHSEREFSNMGLAAIGGYMLSRDGDFSYGLEGRTGTSMVMEGSEDIKTTFVGAYLRGNYRINRPFQVYGAIGAAAIDFDGDYIGRSFGGVSGIAGIELVNKDETIYFFADYTVNRINADINYFDDDVNFDTITVGIRYAF